ncbi:tetratricopeptide repeat protein [Longirhabdus pacifica]|uniref:tetratricopeptide repeat protein n=1 Tax=Longirhabdus pacifica TaxID=2305227 RepID=UPI001008E591|nr:hypothetical protein [Longirhabdus pacifica]
MYSDYKREAYEEWHHGRIVNAINKLTQHINTNPYDGEAMLSLGLLFLQNYQFEASCKQFFNILKINPYDQSAREYLTLYHHRIREYNILKEQNYLIITKSDHDIRELINKSIKYISQSYKVEFPPCVIFHGFRSQNAAYTYGRPIHKAIHFRDDVTENQVLHELAHVFFEHLFLVFAEGMAVYIEKSFFGDAKNRIPDYDFLLSVYKESFFHHTHFYTHYSKSYNESFFFLISLIKEYGFDTIKTFYERTRGMVLFSQIDSVFQEIFEKNMKNYLLTLRGSK